MIDNQEWTEATYHNNKRIINRLAYSWANATGIDESDFLSEANEEFMKSISLWNPKQGAKFSTYFYNRLNYRFRSFTTRFYNRNKIEIKPDKEILQSEHTNNIYSNKKDYRDAADIPANSPEAKLMFKQWVLALSKESQFILETIWNTPADIVKWATEESDNPKTTGRLIQRYLRKLGWEWEVIWSCLGEIRAEIKNL